MLQAATPGHAEFLDLPEGDRPECPEGLDIHIVMDNYAHSQDRAGQAFYERLGFKTLSDTGFENGHPIIMQHPSGVVLNLLGPADTPNDKNILMDTDEKYPGITHVSFKVGSIDAARQFLAGNDIPLSGQFSFKDLRAIFIPRPPTAT